MRRGLGQHLTAKKGRTRGKRRCQARYLRRGKETSYEGGGGGGGREGGKKECAGGTVTMRNAERGRMKRRSELLESCSDIAGK